MKLAEATIALQAGQIVAYPTEAVYGLGCDPFNKQAVLRLLELKQRPVEKGLILIASELQQLLPYIEFNGDWTEQVLASWPGPHTWLIPSAADLPYWINGGHDSVACRVTAHPLAAELCRQFGGALVSTSANLSNQTPARSAAEVRQHCPGVDAILEGELGGAERPTPIRDARSGKQIRL